MDQHSDETATRLRVIAGLQILVIAALVAGCGGGGSDAAPAPPTGGPAPAPIPAPTPSVAQRAQAAKATADSSSNACQSIKPFYWEIGDRTAALASDSTDAASGNPTYTASTVMSIASATKWLYGAYVTEKRAGVLSASDIKFLHFRSGYVRFDAFGSCGLGDTVDSCLNAGNNGAFVASSDNKFNYDGGHMQKHGSLDGLGALGVVALATEIRSQLGTDIALSFSQPQLAGGAITSAADYARFLRKMLNGSLRMGALLGSSAVCTNPTTCIDAVASPTPANENWQYSLGHWVDADPVVGDGAFSSTGAFGFHPWIDAGKTTYGVIARRTSIPGTGFDSATCGRLLRRAWATGVAQ
jgi:hypothetical protein